MEEIFDINGNPTDEYLYMLTEYNIFGDDKVNLKEYLGLIRDGWRYRNIGFVLKHKKKKIKLELHTIGFCSNERIIKAIRENVDWNMFWVKSKIGGHYYYEFSNEYLKDFQFRGVKNEKI